MDELFKKYNKDEVAEKTFISSIYLKKLEHKEFDKIDEIKFIGFLKILKTEYPDIDFSELESEGNEYYSSIKKEEKIEPIKELEEPKSDKSYLFIIVLIVLVVVLWYKMTSSDKPIEENNKINLKPLKIETKIETKIEKNETNNTLPIVKEVNETNNSVVVEKPVVIIHKQLPEENKTKEIVNSILVIKPLRKVWFKIYYLDSPKTREFYTSKEVDVKIPQRVFIKFGNGMVELFYNNKKLEPHTKHITRVIIQDGEMNLTKFRLKRYK